MEQSTSTPLTTRSTAMTLMPFSIASSTAGATASESTGLTIRTAIFLEIRSSMSLVCFAESSPASTTMRSTPSSFAFASAPSDRVTKKGLFRVDRDRPTLPSTAAAPSSAAAVSSPASAASVSAAVVSAGLLLPHAAMERTMMDAVASAASFFSFIPFSSILKK